MLGGYDDGGARRAMIKSRGSGGKKKRNKGRRPQGRS